VPDVPKPTFEVLVQLYVVPATGLEKFIPATGIPPQKAALATVLTLVVGLTVTLKEVLFPVHPPTKGVTVTVATCIFDPALIAVKEGIFPLPEVPKPTFTELVHANVAPAEKLVKAMAALLFPLQVITFEMVLTVGLCLTVTVKVVGVPEHPPTRGVTVMVAVTSALLLLLAIKAGIEPEPEVPKPILADDVQSNDAPAEELVKLMEGADVSSQYERFEIGLTVALVGLTVTLNDCAGPGHPLRLGVTVTVEVTEEVPGLVAVKAGIEPEPEFPNPTLAELVQVKVVPAVGLLKLIAELAVPLQTLTFPKALTVATGRMVTSKLEASPTQPLTDGTTVTLAVTFEVPLLTAVKLGIFPEPDVPKPMLVELVQKNVAPALELLKEIPLTPAPLQAVTLPTGFTVATGLTVNDALPAEVVSPEVTRIL